MARKRYRRYNKGKRWARGLGHVGSMAFNAFKIASSVASLINTEWKLYDRTALSGESIDNAGAVYRFSGLTQGDDRNQRDGNSILPKKWLTKFNIYKNSSATTTTFRIMWIMDKEYDGANPAVTDILKTASYNSFMKYANLKRFKVLRNERITLHANKPMVAFDRYINFNIPNRNPKRQKRKWTHIRYQGTTDGEGDARQNQLLILMISDQAANTPTVDLQSRLRYIDN